MFDSRLIPDEHIRESCGNKVDNKAEDPVAQGEVSDWGL